MAAKIIKQGNEQKKRRKILPPIVFGILGIIVLLTGIGVYLWKTDRISFDVFRPEETITEEKADQLFNQSWQAYQKNRDVNDLLATWELYIKKASDNNRDTLIEHRNSALLSAGQAGRALELLKEEDAKKPSHIIYVLMARQYSASNTEKSIELYEKAITAVDQQKYVKDAEKIKQGYRSEIEAIKNPPTGEDSGLDGVRQ